MKISKMSRIPLRLQVIPSPPKVLFHNGTTLSTILKRPCVAVVGSRLVSPYGEQITYELAFKLAEQGIVIISGLALGVDSIAHQAALESKGLTVAVLPSSLELIVPATHSLLARRIIEGRGALVSEYPEGSKAFKQNYIARNRLIAGLADVIVITEAAEASGSLYTARFGLAQNKIVMAVPGNITSPTSKGTNNLLRAGALPVTSYSDILEALNLSEHGSTANYVQGDNAEEQILIQLIIEGINESNTLLKLSKLPVNSFNQTITILEIKGKIRSVTANRWSLA